MSLITDMLFPPWTRDMLLGPVGRILVEEFKRFSHRGHDLFGTGEQPNLPAPPPRPTPGPPTGGTGPTQDEIDKLNDTIKRMQQELKELHDAATHASDQSGANSDDGRRTNDRILRNGSDLGGALAPQGSTPEAESGRLAAMQQQIDALTKNVQDKSNNANGIADALRNVGMGMPPLGMGMPGMGMPALGGLGGLGAPALSPLGAPAVAPHPADDLKPPKVTPADKDPLAPPKVTTPADQAPPSSGATAPGTRPASTPPAAPGAAATAQPGNAPAAPPAPPPESKDITLPSGQVVTAPNPAAAKAVRNAINQPAGKGDVATTAYAGTGVDIPTDGAEPGRKIDPSDLQAGDIAIFDDHTAIVAGNGQLVGPDGKLQPLGVINDMPGFNGFYRPTEPADTPPPTAPPPGAPPEHDGSTTLASPPPATATDTQAGTPGFGLPQRPPQHVG